MVVCKINSYSFNSLRFKNNVSNVYIYIYVYITSREYELGLRKLALMILYFKSSNEVFR